VARKRANKGSMPHSGQERVVIDAVGPLVDCGRFPIKRVVGDEVEVWADAFADGHDLVACILLVRRLKGRTWTRTRMSPLGNDRYKAVFKVSEVGCYSYTVHAHIDRFGSLCQEFARRPLDDPDLPLVYAQAQRLMIAAADRVGAPKGDPLREVGVFLQGSASAEEKRHALLNEALALRVYEAFEHLHETAYERELQVVVDPPRARHSAWYEFFPRSLRGTKPARLRDAGPLLSYIASMGFDVVYVPPLSPIGRLFRKGPQNTMSVDPDDVGSPWAIGSAEGGHKSVAKSLGGLADFRVFMKKAQACGLAVALDIAFQCAPDHPYVKEHPQWFRHRSDGSIQYAENPPKKYQDIYPLDFETDDWQALWQELKSIVLFWVEEGVEIFRVDNPHTKAFSFWEWLITEVKADHPQVLFLAEAFTRPRVMDRLAKLGFSYSYTYFTWRNTKSELTAYFEELTRTPLREYFRPHLWPNTPDILPGYLQYAGRSAFIVRLVLAATLGAHYGIYGPAFELMDHTPREAGSEEYRDSEKYQRRVWDLTRGDSLREIITRINRIRAENSALQSDKGLLFHAVDNDNLLCFSKTADDLSSTLVMVVNLDPHHKQGGFVRWSADGVAAPGRPVQMHDLLSDARYLWSGSHHYVELAPDSMPAHILRVRPYVRTEHDFDYYS